MSYTIGYVRPASKVSTNKKENTKIEPVNLILDETEEIVTFDDVEDVVEEKPKKRGRKKKTEEA